jgi:hypothetical protein
MSDTIERSDELDRRLARSGSIRVLTEAGRRNRRMIRLLSVAIVLDILLSVGLGVTALRASQIAAQANSLEQQARTTCLAGNDARAGQRSLWQYLLSLPPPTPRTLEQQQQVDRFRAYVNKVFQARRC